MGQTGVAPARQAAYDLLRRIEREGEHSDDLLHSEAIAELTPRDRDLVTEIVYGTLRWRAWLDYILRGAIAGRWARVGIDCKILLRLSLYQMSRMDRVPDHAITHEAVNLAKEHLKSRAASGFVNAVLRGLGRRRPWTAPDFWRDCPPWIRVSLPRWLWDRWCERYGTDRTCEYALALNRPSRSAMRLSEKIAPGVIPQGWVPSDLVPNAYIPGSGADPLLPKAHPLMDEASQLIPHLFGPLGGATIWDACAAPGGKTVILRDQGGVSGWVVSSDLRYARARKMKELLPSSGNRRCSLVVADAGFAPPFPACFDAVLADVPCSGLGTLRRNPEIKWRFQPSRLAELSSRQGMILQSVAGAVRKGGRLLYSTCSTEPEENEGIIRDFLRSNPGFALATPDFPHGIERWLDAFGMFRSFPATRVWDGFFAALMVRNT
jgi:16S rRNA (cytosine967-C5)-methyltransferase